MTSDRADELLAGWRARLDEDEAAANASQEARATDTWDEMCQEDVDHYARHDPARALREIPGKRLVLDEHLPIESIYGVACKRCVSWQDAPLAEGGETEFGIAIPDPWPCVPVRAVAASWEA